MSVFSPLALTQTLPFLPLAQGDIDYEVARRGEPDLFAKVLAEPANESHPRQRRQSGRAARPRRHRRLRQRENAPRPTAGRVRCRGTRIAPIGARDIPRLVRADDWGEHVVAVDVTHVQPNDTTITAATARSGGADDAFAEVPAHESQENAKSLLESAATRFDWVDLRGFAPHASAREAGQATSAISLSMWHARQRHCPTCGAPVEPALGGWAQHCTNDEDGNRLLFPRIEPAVITAIVDHDDRLLLQHNSAWRNNGLYSVSAGFVEAGENLEHACRREAKEEVGIEIGELKYLGSQPWPFPSSLMMAFKGVAVTTDVHVDGEETLQARWVTRDEYMSELVSGRMEAPGKATIARYMIEEWLGHDLP